MENGDSNPRTRLQSLAEEINIEERPHATEVDGEVSRIKPTKKLSIKKIIFYGGIVLLLILLVVVTSVYFILEGKKAQDKNTDEVQSSTGVETSSGSNTETGSGTNAIDEEAEMKKIAYLYEGNVWVINEDGTGKKKITDADESPESYYSNPQWKEVGVVSYSRCLGGECTIYSYDLEETKQVIERKFASSGIISFGWAHESDRLAYFYTDDNGARYLDLWDGESLDNLDSWTEPIYGRGGSFDDGNSISFSSDDNYILLFYTIGVPGQDSIIIYSEDGDEVISIGSEDDSGFPLSTFPNWLNDEEIIYKADSTLYQHPVVSSVAKILTSSFSGYDLHLSPDQSRLSYWLFGDNGITNSYYYDLGDDMVVKIIDDMVDLEWLNNNSLVGRTTEPIDGAMVPFEYKGLATVDIDGRNFKIIVPENIVSFSVER